jgi:hypothetical protein
MAGHIMRLKNHSNIKTPIPPIKSEMVLSRLRCSSSCNSPLYDVIAGGKCVMKESLGLYPECTAGAVSHDLLL